MIKRSVHYCPACKSFRANKFPIFRLNGSVEQLLGRQKEVFQRWLNAGTDRKLTAGERKVLRRALHRLGGKFGV